MEQTITVPKPYVPIPFSKMMDGPTDINWIIDGIMPRTTCGILAGEPGVGKTWIAMDLVLAVASGRPWVDKYDTRPSKVLVIDEENAQVLVRRRFISLAWRYEQYELLDNIDFLVGNSIDITPLEHLKRGMVPSTDYVMLYDVIAEGEYDLIVFDSLTRIHHADENDSSKMSMVFSYVKKLMDDLGCSILFTHHYNKGRGRSNNRLRGSSDILAFPDYVLRVDTDKSHHSINENGVIIEHGKSRFGENVGDIIVVLDGEDNRKQIKRISANDLNNALMTYLEVARTRKDVVKEMQSKGLGSPSAIDRELNKMIKEKKIYRPTKGIFQITGLSQFNLLNDLL